MQIKVTAGDITSIKTDGIIINLFEGSKKPDGATAAVDKLLNTVISQMLSAGEFKGKLNEVAVIPTFGKLPAKKVAIVGLGKPEQFALDRIRQATAEAARTLRNSGAKRIASIVHGAGAGGISPEHAGQMVAEGAILGLYTFAKYQTKSGNSKQVDEFLLIESDTQKIPAVQSGVKKGEIIANAVNFTRDLVNEPASVMTPTELANRARKIARQVGLEIKVLGRPELEKLGFGALLAVAKGSQQPPQFIILRYWGAGKKSKLAPVGLIGKGITFDSGGISIKPWSGMDEMKADMAGAAAVIGTMVAIAQLKPKLNVTALVPATENLPSGSAFKPGDILRTFSGNTIEIVTTDAEGRLILADAIGYAKRLGLTPLIDVATLTGACDIALGPFTSGAFGNNQQLIDELIQASKPAGEYIWQMPMFEEYAELDKSNIADIKNIGGRSGGAITAAKFIEFFVGDTPWVHFDIAPTNFVGTSEKEKHYRLRGATGVMVRTLVNYLLSTSLEMNKRRGK
ncbi:MAG: leucyl aminopeptidase [bacterium]|nr:leucyl aminopeptidase [bacterium]